jgi:hypothetical protein
MHEKCEDGQTCVFAGIYYSKNPKMDENGQYKIVHTWMILGSNSKIIHIWMIIVYLSL